MFASRCAIFLTLIFFVLLNLKDGQLTAERAFVVTAFFNVIKVSMCSQFPFSIARIVEISASSKRIQSFLLCSELEKEKSVGDLEQSRIEGKSK